MGNSTKIIGVFLGCLGRALQGGAILIGVSWIGVACKPPHQSLLTQGQEGAPAALVKACQDTDSIKLRQKEGHKDICPCVARKIAERDEVREASYNFKSYLQQLEKTDGVTTCLKEASPPWSEAQTAASQEYCQTSYHLTLWLPASELEKVCSCIQKEAEGIMGPEGFEADPANFYASLKQDGIEEECSQSSIDPLGDLTFSPLEQDRGSGYQHEFFKAEAEVTSVTYGKDRIMLRTGTKKTAVPLDRSDSMEAFAMNHHGLALMRGSSGTFTWYDLRDLSKVNFAADTPTSMVDETMIVVEHQGAKLLDSSCQPHAYWLYVTRNGNEEILKLATLTKRGIKQTFDLQRAEKIRGIKLQGGRGSSVMLSWFTSKSGVGMDADVKMNTSILFNSSTLTPTVSHSFTVEHENYGPYYAMGIDKNGQGVLVWSSNGFNWRVYNPDAKTWSPQKSMRMRVGYPSIEFIGNDQPYLVWIQLDSRQHGVRGAFISKDQIFGTHTIQSKERGHRFYQLKPFFDHKAKTFGLIWKERIRQVKTTWLARYFPAPFSTPVAIQKIENLGGHREYDLFMESPSQVMVTGEGVDLDEESLPSPLMSGSP